MGGGDRGSTAARPTLTRNWGGPLFIRYFESHPQTPIKLLLVRTEIISCPPWPGMCAGRQAAMRILGTQVVGHQKATPSSVEVGTTSTASDIIAQAFRLLYVCLKLASGVFTFLHLCVSLSFLVLGVQVTVTSRPRPTRDVSRFCDTSNMQRQVSRPPAPQLSPQEGGVKVRDGDRAVRERFIQKRGETYLVLPRKRC